jgi:hypothetical protein
MMGFRVIRSGVWEPNKPPIELAQPCTTLGEKDVPPDSPGTTVPAPWTTSDMQTAENARTEIRQRRIVFIVVLLRLLWSRPDNPK